VRPAHQGGGKQQPGGEGGVLVPGGAVGKRETIRRTKEKRIRIQTSGSARKGVELNTEARGCPAPLVKEKKKHPRQTGR